MNKFTQEQETEILRCARNLTAAIITEEDEITRLQSMPLPQKPAEPAMWEIDPPLTIQPIYPPKPKTSYTYTDFTKDFLQEKNLTKTKLILLIIILNGLLILLLPVAFLFTFSEYKKKQNELNGELAKNPEYVEAVAEAERIAEEKNKEAYEEYLKEKDRLEKLNKEEIEEYNNKIIPQYNTDLALWKNQQARKIEIIANDLKLNKETLDNLYTETLLVSATYRELWILDWLYNDMSTSDHDIRYATELLDRDRQRLATERAGQVTVDAINSMANDMRQSFTAIYDAIETGNEIQQSTLATLSKTRRDMNIGNIIETVQHHNTNKKLDKVLED